MADIVVTKLCKAFDGKPVLEDVSLRLPEGQTTCLSAPSGAGKTTLLRILLGLESPDAGRVEGLEGRRCAVVFQEDRLLEHLSAVGNLRLVNPRLDRDEARAALGRFGLSGSADQPVRELSGGMRRRVALLRALLSEWDVLMMDEPFTALDDATRAQVIAQTARLIRGRTALLITHSAEEAHALGARTVTL